MPVGGYEQAEQQWQCSAVAAPRGETKHHLPVSAARHIHKHGPFMMTMMKGDKG